LTQRDVAQLRNRGHVKSFIEFAPGHALVYVLEGSFHMSSVAAVRLSPPGAHEG
jgi:hypothetical protein